MRTTCVVGLIAVGLLPVGAAQVDASDPWAKLHRPLRIPRLAPGERCPVTSAQRVSPDFAPAQGSGPVYPVGAAHGLRFIHPPTRDQLWYPTRWSGQKVLWIARVSYGGRVLIRGRQLDGPHELRFGDGQVPARELRLHGRDAFTENWQGRQWLTYTRLRAPGCYAWQVDGASFSKVIVFRARVVGASGGGTASTTLAITFLNSNTNGDATIRLRLQCAPPRGNVLDPAAACRTLDRQRGVLLARERKGICIGGITFTDTRVVGTYRGKKVERFFEHCFNSDRTAAWQGAMKITALDVYVTKNPNRRPREFYLDCQPTQGSVPNPARSCAALERDSDTLLRGGQRTCPPSLVYVVGLYRGRPVATACDEPASSRKWLAVLGIRA